MKSNNRQKAFKSIYHLHVFPGEFEADINMLQFDDHLEYDPEKRELQTELEDVRSTLSTTQRELSQYKDAQLTLENRVEDLYNQNIFLNHHVVALEAEVQEGRHREAELDRNQQQLYLY